jgi:hypothetical protein
VTRPGAIIVALFVGGAVAWPLVARADDFYFLGLERGYRRGHRTLGIMLDAGVPDGVSGSLVYRPDRQLRAHVGGGHNLVSWGVRGGVTMLASPRPVSPSLTLEVGHYFPGDANPAWAMFASGEAGDVPALRSVGYRYANLRVGVELGGARVTWFVHGGLSYVTGRVRGLDETLAGGARMPAPTTPAPALAIKDDPRVSAFALSARLGCVYYF